MFCRLSTPPALAELLPCPMLVCLLVWDDLQRVTGLLLQEARPVSLCPMGMCDLLAPELQPRPVWLRRETSNRPTCPT